MNSQNFSQSLDIHSGNLGMGTLTANPAALDNNLKILNPAKPLAYEFSGTIGGGPYSW